MQVLQLPSEGGSYITVQGGETLAKKRVQMGRRTENFWQTSQLIARAAEGSNWISPERRTVKAWHNISYQSQFCVALMVKIKWDVVHRILQMKFPHLPWLRVSSVTCFFAFGNKNLEGLVILDDFKVIPRVNNEHDVNFSLNDFEIRYYILVCHVGRYKVHIRFEERIVTQFGGHEAKMK